MKIANINSKSSGNGDIPPEEPISGSSNVFVNNSSVIRQTDIWQTKSGEYQTNTLKGSSNIFVNNIPLVRVNDSLSNDPLNKIISGSDNVQAN